MKENKQKKLQERLEELYRIQDARLECNADDLDIREEIAEVEEEIKELQDNANVDRKNSIEEDINRCNKLTETINANWIGISNQLAIEHILSDYKRVLKENEELKNKLLDTLEGQKVIEEETPQYISENYISKQKIKDKIEELEQKREEYYNENKLIIDNIINKKNFIENLILKIYTHMLYLMNLMQK